MAHESTHPPCWDTAAHGQPASDSALKHTALSDHLNLCGALRGPLQALRAGASELRQWFAGRVVTSMLFLALLLGASWLMR